MKAPEYPGVQWLTTAPNPKSPMSGYDAGQRGWRTHAVRIAPVATLKDARVIRSECGILPPHGWGLDLFIERRCARCLRALGVACKVCRGKGTNYGPRFGANESGHCFDCNGTGLERKSA